MRRRRRAGKPSIVRVYPLAAIVDRPAAFSAPMIAAGAEAQRILEIIAKDSAPFGTEMKIETASASSASPAEPGR